MVENQARIKFRAFEEGSEFHVLGEVRETSEMVCGRS